MKDLSEDQLLLLELANLCVANVPLSYSERNAAIWEAFRTGRAYELALGVGSCKPALATSQKRPPPPGGWTAARERIERFCYAPDSEEAESQEGKE